MQVRREINDRDCKRRCYEERLEKYCIKMVSNLPCALFYSEATNPPHRVLAVLS